MGAKSQPGESRQMRMNKGLQSGVLVFSTIKRHLKSLVSAMHQHFIVQTSFDTNKSQAPYFYSQITKMSPLVCGMHQPGHPTPRFPPACFPHRGPKCHRAMERRRLQTRRSSSSRSQKTPPTIRSTGRHGAEMPRCCPWACTAWWAAE